jgi:hypothetical protein
MHSTMITLFALLLVACGGPDDHGDPDDAGRASIEFRCAADRDVGFVQGGDAVTLTPPYSLATTTAGVSVSVFPEDAGLLELLILQIHVASRRAASTECSVVLTFQNPPENPRRVRVGNREGTTFRLEQADLVEAVRLLQASNSSRCDSVGEPGDLAITTLEITPGQAGVSPRLDAVAFGRTADALPTAATSPPECLQP